MTYRKLIAALAMCAVFSLYAADHTPEESGGNVIQSTTHVSHTSSEPDTATLHGYRTVQPSSVSSSGDSCCCPAPCQPSCCSPCCCLPKCCGSFDLIVDALYWRVCGDGKLFALTDTVVTNVNETRNFQRVRPDNEWGVKALGRYTTCDGCKFVSLSYLYFDETDRARVLNPLDVSYLQSTTNQLSSVNVKVHHEYQRLDARAGHYICQGCCGAFYGYGGVSWIYIENKDRLEGVELATPNRNLSFNQRTRYSAAGFEAGLGGRYMIGCGFGLSAEFGGIAAIGERRSRFAIVSLDTNAFVNGVEFSDQPSSTACVPGLDLKLEAFYERQCGCLKLGLGIGYEQQYYFDALRSNRLYFGNANALAPDQFSESRNIGFGGLNITGRIGY